MFFPVSYIVEEDKGEGGVRGTGEESVGGESPGQGGKQEK